MENQIQQQESMKNILIKLPESMQQRIRNIPEHTLRQLEEIRIRTGTDTRLIGGGREINLHDREEISAEVLDEILNRLLEYSYYAYEEELARGYITVEGGHRVGICGRVSLQDGKVHLIKDISSLNIRRSREITGASDKILGSVLREDPAKSTFGTSAKDNVNVRNTLIISPPKCGKTTILRDLARNLSNRGFRIGICDERSEIAGCCNGSTSYDLGPRTDVLDGCPKAEGILMLIRAMSPDVVMTDEIGKPEDASAIRSALSAGVKIVTTIHGSSFEDAAKSAVGDLITDHIFETLIILTAQPKTGTVRKILQLADEKDEKAEIFPLPEAALQEVQYG